MVSPYNISDEFPVAGKVNYLATAGVGLIPRSVVERIKWFYERALKTPPYDDLFDDNARIVEKVRSEFAHFINASESEVSFQTNTSTSISNVFRTMKFGAADNVIIDDLGFPSATYPVIGLREREGVEHQTRRCHVRLLDQRDESGHRGDREARGGARRVSPCRCHPWIGVPGDRRREMEGALRRHEQLQVAPLALRGLRILHLKEGY